MADTPYIYERQSEYWTSREIENFFRDLGFEVLALPLSQLVEKPLPADFIFFDKEKSKLFGFQYKALYMNANDYWPINFVQHQTISKYPWIYYCLSELREPSEHRVALHLARIIKPRFEYSEKLFASGEQKVWRYSRWGAFYQSLRKCPAGVKVKSAEHLRALIIQDPDDVRLERLANQAVDIFLADFYAKHLAHYSPFG